VYHLEAAEKTEAERNILGAQYKIMEKRLWYGITWPSAIGTILFGGWMVALNPALLEMGWLQIKLLFVLGLCIYHWQCGAIVNQLKNDVFKYSSDKMRLWNEVATLFLVAIVFIVVLRSSLDWIYALIGFIAFAVALMIAIRIYKRIRNNNK
jgi:protoporphyrinogen IX oxidase